MRKYLTVYKMRLETTLIYRGSVIIYRLSNLFFLAMIIAVWFSANSTGNLGGYTKDSLITYYLIGSFLNAIVFWSSTRNIREEINNGDINTKTLTKPISYYWQKFFEEFGWHTVSPLFSIFSVLLVAFFVRDNLVILLDPSKLLLMILSTALASILFFNMSSCLGILSFWFTETEGLTSFIWMGIFLLGGQAIPLTFFPDSLRSIISMLPFRYVYSFPMELYFQDFSKIDLIKSFLTQTIWIAIFALIFKVLWSKGLQRYSANGG